MEAKHNIVSWTFAWPLLAIASFALGLAASDTAATLGITNFSHDHRGEWGAIIAPLLMLFALAVGLWPYRHLSRNYKSAIPALVAVTIAVVSCAWVTWRFARGG